MRRFWRGLGRRAAALLARLGLLQPGKIMYIGGSGTLPTPLTREEEAQVIARLEQGDEEARQTLIERNLRLVVYIARRFENTGVNLEDLISIGTIGLIKAVGTYQPAKSIKLATYASRCIENEILMYLRKIAAQKSELSFDEPLNTDWDGNELLLSDVLGTESDLVMRPIEADVDRQLLRQALERLEPREKQIITLRFGLDGRQERTQKEVADQLGISQSYISRLEKRIIARLKKEMARLEEYVLAGKDLRSDEALEKHADWAEEWMKRCDVTPENIHGIVQQEIGKVFAKVLECAGVYKRTGEGQAAFDRFINVIK